MIKTEYAHRKENKTEAQKVLEIAKEQEKNKLKERFEKHGY